MVGTLSIALGTAYYPYATAYYAHNPAANLIIAAAWLIFSPHSTPLKDAGAGFFAGSAVLFDYPAVFAPAVFGLTLLVVRPRALIAFITGGLGPVAVYAWYHTTVFGSPFVTAASFWNPRFLDDGRAFGAFPRPGLLLALTVLPYRGVFFYSPILLAAIYGAGVMLREHRTRAFAAAALLLFMTWLLMNATYNYWWGGRTTGPRFLIPAVVLFGPMIAVAFERVPRICAALCAVSVANYFAIAAVSHSVPATVANPLFDRIYPMFIRGDFDRSNIGLLVGLPGRWSLAPLVLAAMVFTVWARTHYREPPDRRNIVVKDVAAS